MTKKDYEIEYPDDQCLVDQDREWVLVKKKSGDEKVRIHDYARFYSIPGLYEEVVYKHLKCVSPQIMCQMLGQQAEKNDSGPLRVLDFGAGNGMVGKCLAKRLDCRYIAGVDIIPEARDAAMRDHSEVYDDYWVMDLSRLTQSQKKRLEDARFNTLITVAALGFGDIPTKAFVNAFNIMPDAAWVAFNIKESFLEDKKDSGYAEVIEKILGKSLRVANTKRYCHRLSLSGDPLIYVAIVGQKIKNASM